MNGFGCDFLLVSHKVFSLTLIVFTGKPFLRDNNLGLTVVPSPITQRMIYNLRSFRKKVIIRKRAFRRFLTKLEKNPPRGLDNLTASTEKEVWAEIDCLSCANCCKTMTPTYTLKDIKRIAAHLEMTTDEFKTKWLIKERNTGDWLNKSNPCQFLNLKDNKCGIYEVRPVDCSGFPHLPKKKMTDYMHVHKQNLEYCPATFKLVEKMMKRVNGE